MRKLFKVLLTATLLSSICACKKAEPKDEINPETTAETVAVDKKEKTAASENVKKDYKTFYDLMENESPGKHFNGSIMESELYGAYEENGKYYQVHGTLTPEQRTAVEAIDVADRDYGEKVDAIIEEVKISETTEFTDRILTEDERQLYLGATIQKMIDDGFECNGWGIDGEKNSVYVNRDDIVYDCEVDFPPELDFSTDFEYEDLYASMIKNISYAYPRRFPIGENRLN